MSNEPNYTKYLESDPTELMVHVDEWIREKTGFDPSKCRTKAEAFKYGVYLTVALRMHHQASPENQQRLAANRAAAAEREAETAQRREARAAAGAKPRGRLPKKAAEDKAAEKAPAKRRGRPAKAKAAKVTEVIPEVPAAEPAAPKRRTRRAKPVEETAPSNVTSLDEKREEGAAAPVARRRRPVRRPSGEAAF